MRQSTGEMGESDGECFFLSPFHSFFATAGAPHMGIAILNEPLLTDEVALIW